MLFRALVVLALGAVPAHAQSLPRAIDGDTAQYRNRIYRYFGVDTPETRNFLCPEGPRRDRERTAGQAATRRNAELLAQGVRFTGIRYDKAGRTLAVVIVRNTGRSVADILIEEGLGVPNTGETRACRF